MRIKALAISAFILSSLVSYSFAVDGYTGSWNKKESISPIDDSDTITLSLDSLNKIGSGFRSAKPTLVIRCQENKTNAYINWRSFISVTNTKITTRVDKEQAKTQSWEISSNNRATLAPKSIPFIKEMLGKDSLVVRVTPFNDNSYTVKFDIKGLDNAIMPVREACGW